MNRTSAGQNPARRSHRRRHGISLLEVIASVAILAVVVTPMTVMLQNGSRHFGVAAGHDDDARGRDVLRWIRSQIRGAASLPVVRGQRIDLIDSAGQLHSIRHQSDRLTLTTGIDHSDLLTGVTRFEIRDLRTTVPAVGNGLDIQLTLQNQRGNTTTHEMRVAL